MNPGELKQVIFFMLPVRNASPVEYTRSRGKLRTLKGKLLTEAFQNNTEHNREFTIRYQKNLSDSERPSSLYLVWKNIKHDIISIENDDGLNKTMTIVARAVS